LGHSTTSDASRSLRSGDLMDNNGGRYGYRPPWERVNEYTPQ
jgi:hypothetical protein